MSLCFCSCQFLNRDLVLLALELGRLAAQQRSEHRHVLTHVHGRLRVRETEHVLDHDLVREADAQDEAPLGGRLGGEALLCDRAGVARIAGHHRGPELDPLGLPAGDGQRGDRMQAEDVRHPHGVEAARLEVLCPGHQAVQLAVGAARGTRHHTDSHRIAHAQQAVVDMGCAGKGAGIQAWSVWRPMVDGPFGMML